MDVLQLKTRQGLQEEVFSYIRPTDVPGKTGQCLGTQALCEAWSRSRPLQILLQQWFTSLGWARLLWLWSRRAQTLWSSTSLPVDLQSGFTVEQANWIPGWETDARCQWSRGKGNQAGLHPQEVAGLWLSLLWPMFTHRSPKIFHSTFHFSFYALNISIQKVYKSLWRKHDNPPSDFLLCRGEVLSPFFMSSSSKKLAGTVRRAGSNPAGNRSAWQHKVTSLDIVQAGCIWGPCKYK